MRRVAGYGSVGWEIKMTLEGIFGSGSDLRWWQECARAVLIFGYGLAAMRLSGRRAFAKWSALDIIVPVIAGSCLSRALTGAAPLWGTLAATTTLLVLHWLISHAAALSPLISLVVEGRAITLGKEGNLDSRALCLHAVTDADIGEALSSAGVENVGETRRIVLSPSGKLSALPKQRIVS